MSPAMSLKEYYENKAQAVDELGLTYESASAFKRYFYQARFHAVMSCLAPREGETILDLGCGTGYYAKAIRSCGSKVVAVEFSSNYLRQAKTFVGEDEKALFTSASATSLPFSDESFDKVLFTEVIEHLPGYEESVREIKRVLKPEGTATITTPSRYSPMNVAYSLKRFVRRYGFNEHVHEFTKSELIKLLSRYFSVVQFRMANYILPYPLDNLILGIREDNHPIIQTIAGLDRLLSRTPLLCDLGWTMLASVRKDR